jgi:hypothetical protein
VNFNVELTSNISATARADEAALKALRGALLDVDKAVKGVSGQTPQNAIPEGAKADKATGKSDADRKVKEQSKALDLLKKNASKASGAIEVPIKWVAAAAGVAGFAGLAKMAMGYAGMAKLQTLVFQTQMNFRALFRGVDPSPVLRAFEKFSKNLSGTTVTGKALGDILTRGFNSFFRLVEKLEPLASAAFQGMVLGALYAENALLKAEIAFAPYIVAVEKAIGTESGLETAAYAGAIALGVLAVAAAAAAAPFVAAGAAIMAVSAAIQQAVKLYREWDELMAARKKEQLANEGFGDAAYGIKVGKQAKRVYVDKSGKAVEDYGPPISADEQRRLDLAKATAPAGTDAGKALGDGLVKGMNASEAAVKAAGGKLADAATQGVREKAEIHSPSKKMARDGRYMGEGVEQGIDASAPDVQAAAERSLVPEIPSAPKGSPSASKSLASVVMHNVFQIMGGNKEETKAAVLEALDEIVLKAKIQAGVPDEVTP